MAPVQGLLGWGCAGNFPSVMCRVGVPGGFTIQMAFLGMLGICGSNLASDGLEGQTPWFAACFEPPLR